jgi:anti-anti-sigma regulatory factor
VAAADGPRTAVLVVDGGVEVMVAELDERHLDLALVNALARLQLTARRHGFTVCLVEPSKELRGLLELVGLADVFGVGPLVVEPGREAEGGEEVGVEEVVVADDPVS